MSKGKGTEPEKLRNKRSSESNKNLFERPFAPGKAGIQGCTISVIYPDNMIKYQSVGSSSEAKRMPGGNRTVKRK